MTAVDVRQIVAIREGQMLPLREPPSGDFEELLCGAVRRAKPELAVIYTRPQLFIFAPGVERDPARDHALDLIDAGLSDLHQATIINREELASRCEV